MTYLLSKSSVSSPQDQLFKYDEWKYGDWINVRLGASLVAGDDGSAPFA